VRLFPKGVIVEINPLLGQLDKWMLFKQSYLQLSLMTLVGSPKRDFFEGALSVYFHNN
jgi:hypothetical protein